MKGGKLGRWVVSRDKCDAAGESAMIRRMKCHDTAQEAPRYGLGSATVRRRNRHDTAQGAVIPAAERTRARPHNSRHGRACTATRPSVHNDMAGPGLLHGASARHNMTRHDRPRAQCGRNLGHGCVHCALDLVLTQDIVLSHCLDHCS